MKNHDCQYVELDKMKKVIDKSMTTVRPKKNRDEETFEVMRKHFIESVCKK